MSKLVPRQIFLDIQEWEELGEKIGKRNRSDWIRQQIHEEVKIAEETEILEEQISQTESLLDKMKGKMEEIQQETQNKIDQMGNDEERLFKAFEEAETLARKQTKRLRRNDVPRPSIGLDQIQEIAERYMTDKNELEQMIRIELNPDIPKYGILKLKETKDSVYMS